jgi:methylase of polypeptide subunit release factors
MDFQVKESINAASLSYLEATPLDMTEVPTARLNIEEKERSNLFPWNGQFSPQLIEALLERYANPETHVLDPFCGSGTVLGEAARLGLSATGIEVNPAAYILARIYSFTNVMTDERQKALNEVEAKLHGIFPKGWQFFKTLDTKPSEIYQQELVAICDGLTSQQRAVLEAVIILADFFKGINATKLAKIWEKLLMVIEELPYNSNPIDIQHGDGRFLEHLSDVDLILTSPPYINVYNYHQQYRASAEALGWNLLEVARAEIGSNRKHRGNRFLTVIQYCLDITKVLNSLWTATTQNARLIFILGRESKVRGVPFFNGEIVARLAIDAIGYKLALRQERVFMNRFGQHIYEDILHFTKGHMLFTESQERARAVAEFILRQPLPNATDKTIRHDLQDAISKVDLVSCSPRFITKSPHQLQDIRTNHELSDPTPRKAQCHSCKRQTAGA